MTVGVLAAQTYNPLTPDPVEIVVGLVCFLALYLALRHRVLPELERIYAERTEHIEGGMKRAEEVRQEALGLQQEYEEQLGALRAEAARIRDEARAEGALIRQELRDRAEAEVERMRWEGEQQLAAARDQVRRELLSDLAPQSMRLAERILGSRLDSGRVPTSVVEAFLADVEGRSPGGSARSRR
jgi:F-type H+-transporting ATPase subunit b